MQLTVGRLETAAMEEKALLLRYAQYRYCPHANSGMYMYMNNCKHSTPERERTEKKDRPHAINVTFTKASVT